MASYFLFIASLLAAVLKLKRRTILKREATR